MIQLRAVSIGADARNLTATCHSAQVNGITSRGIFLLTQDQRVIFISFEGWRGPWTVNLTDQKVLDKPGPCDGEFSGHPFPISRISIGTRVSLQPHQILFPVEGTQIVFEHLNGWMDDPIRAENPSRSEINERLDQVVQLVAGSGSGSGWLKILHTSGEKSGHIPEDLMEVKEILQVFASEMMNSSGNNDVDRFRRILGRGTGLTPSGDDVVIGLLLALSRSGLPEVPGSFDQFSKLIVDLARQTTTSLSSCLIASAANGQADERLVSALDGIIYGKLPVIDCAARLQAYGSSSGGDSLLGMYTVLKANYPL